MKKHGFTLAEVLITLGIIGVVSALVIPTFTAQTQAAKIGPRVGKAISSFEQATKALIEDNGADFLSGIEGYATTTNAPQARVDNFMTGLSSHMKGSSVASFTPRAASNGSFLNNTSGNAFLASDGVMYHFATASAGTVGDTGAPHQRQYYNRVMIDINGDAEPNSDARDRFYFQLMDDGSLRPFGGQWDTDHVWRTTCNTGAKPTAANARYCAGHIVENGMKALYK